MAETQTRDIAEKLERGGNMQNMFWGKTRYDVVWNVKSQKTREIKNDLLDLTFATGWIVVSLPGVESII